jgi:hypothetical protein
MKHPFRTATVLLLATSLSFPALAGIFGPAVTSLNGDALTAKLASQPIVMSTTGGLLDVRSKSAAIGSFLVGFVVSSALASGGGMPGQNAQQMQQSMQANMQIATTFNTNLQGAMTKVASDQAEKPKAQVAREGPVVLVSQQLLDSLLQQRGLRTSLAAEGKEPAATDLQLRVSQPVWKLDFSMASSNYTLLYQTDVSLYQKETDTVFFNQSCKGEVARKLPLEDWQRDDFSEVALAATEIGTRCAQPVIAALGLASFTAQTASVAAIPSAPETAPRVIPAAAVAVKAELPQAVQADAESTLAGAPVPANTQNEANAP